MRRTLILLVSALATLLTACADGPNSSADDRLAVVATTTQVGSVAAEIGGDAIDLTTLLQPGIEAHDFELSAEAGARLETADLVLISGAGLEDWLVDALENIGVGDRVRDISAGIELRETTPSGDGHEDEEHGSGTDPHYWLAAPNAVVMVENVREALAAADPANAGGFEDRATRLIERLQAADAEVRSLIAEVPPVDRKLVTDHDALGYFIDEYGLEFVGSIFPSLDVSSEPSARDVELLVQEVRSQGVRAIFSESSVNPALAQAVAAETDAVVVDEPLYTDSLGAAESGAETLDAMLLHNARVIRDGLLGD